MCFLEVLGDFKTIKIKVFFIGEHVFLQGGPILLINGVITPSL